MTMTIESSSDYPTTDTVLATWLVMNGYEPSEIQNDSFPAVFIFMPDGKKFKEIVTLYNLNRATGNITHFYTCYRRMLTLIKRGR